MQSIDKNDVNISRLFNWGREIILVDQYGSKITTEDGEPLKLYIRIVGDSELNRARVAALRASAELRKKLHEEDSDERVALVPDAQFIEDENLVEAILGNEIRSIAADVVRSLESKLVLPVEPKSDAPLEDLEKHQEEIDAWPEKRTQQISEELARRLGKERERISKLSRQKQEQLFEKVLINSYCEDEMQKVFNEWCVYFGTYADPDYKDRAFEDFGQCQNLPKDIKEQLFEAYNSLDLSLDFLKK